MIAVYAVFKNEKEAKEISKKLIKKKLIACANLFPIKSLYRWKGKLNEEQECAALLKTAGKNFDLIKKEIERTHSYEIPCIEKINVKANKKYEDWVINELK